MLRLDLGFGVIKSVFSSNRDVCLVQGDRGLSLIWNANRSVGFLRFWVLAETRSGELLVLLMNFGKHGWCCCVPVWVL